jgi:hypothetical protein
MKPRTCTNASKLMQVAKENSSEVKRKKIKNGREDKDRTE